MSETGKISIEREKTPAAQENAPLPAEFGWEPFAALRREIDRLFEDAVSSWPLRSPMFGTWPRMRMAAFPAADIVEKDDEFTLTLDLPGMKEEDIEVSLSDGAISIRGKRIEERVEEKENYRLSERRHGSFARSFTLPPSVDDDKVSASYEKGVLTLRMPKSEEARKKQRKIDIKAA